MSLISTIGNLWAGRGGQPERDTEVYPRLMGLLAGQRVAKKWPVFKPTPWNLRSFARTPYARRAINAVKNPIAMLGWEIVPKKGIDESPELQRQIDVATYCLQNPNAEDSWRSLLERVVEDILVSAGAVELQLSGDQNRPLWLYPADGLSIQIYPAWAGDPNEAHYCQVPGYGMIAGPGVGINLRDDELIFIVPNPSTSTPFGCAPLEVAFMSISRLLGVAEYAGNLSSNARPGSLLNLGEGIDSKGVDAFRAYWTNDIEGQGQLPIIGGGLDPSVLRLYPEGDKALFLAYQDFLKREIAIAFDLSPQNLGVEADVNRNTSETAEDRDWDQAIKPMAGLVAQHLNREAITRKLGFSQIEFRWVGLDREDEQATAEIYDTYYKANLITPDEQRERLGMPPADNEWGALTYADTQIAINAARGAARVEDPDLPELSKKTETEKPGTGKKKTRSTKNA